MSTIKPESHFEDLAKAEYRKARGKVFLATHVITTIGDDQVAVDFEQPVAVRIGTGDDGLIRWRDGHLEPLWKAEVVFPQDLPEQYQSVRHVYVDGPSYHQDTEERQFDLMTETWKGRWSRRLRRWW